MVPYVDAVVAVTVVRGMSRVGGLCEMCLARGVVGGEGGE